MENSLIALKIAHLKIRFQKSIVLNEVNLNLEAGKIHVLVGPNGSGKTSILNALSGVTPYEGEIFLHEQNLAQLNRKELSRIVSMIPSSNLGPSIQVEEFIEMARFPYTNFLGKLKPTDQQIIEKSIELVGVQKLLKKSLNELSDGERKKVMITAALVQDCPIMLMDEPTNFLDIGNKYLFSKLVQKIRDELGKTILISSHDMDLVFRVADSILLIKDQTIAQHKVEEVRNNKLIESAFQQYGLKLDADGRIEI